jgi:Tol biopolymer transport system component
VSASTREETQAEYSRDGSRIAFASNRSGNWEIWVAAADGSRPRQVTTFAAAPASNPRWSPNGRLLAFNHSADGNADIYTMTPEGSSIRRVTAESSHEEAPAWSRDGRWLYFSSNRSGLFEIWKVEAAGSGPAIQVSRGGGTNPVESPDRQHVYYRKATSGLTIYRTPVNGGDEVQVMGPIPRAPVGAWVPDADGIYFIRPWEIAYYRFATGRATAIVMLPQDSIVSAPGLSLSPDGQWLLYGQRDRLGSDIMLVEGFR